MRKKIAVILNTQRVQDTWEPHITSAPGAAHLLELPVFHIKTKVVVAMPGIITPPPNADVGIGEGVGPMPDRMGVNLTGSPMAGSVNV